MNKLKILIVDDHYLMIEGYKSILAYNRSAIEMIITPATNCEEAYTHIVKHQDVFDLVLLDLALPPYEEKSIRNGEDLAYLVVNYMPQAKIVIMTSHAEAFRLYNIIKSINPSGLMVKSDFTAEEFLFAIDSIISGNLYYSTTVNKHIRNFTAQQIYLDNYNRQIISLLSQGIKTKNLPDHLPLSMSAIDKRKSQIRDYFCIDRGTDEDIIREAKKQNLI